MAVGEADQNSAGSDPSDLSLVCPHDEKRNQLADTPGARAVTAFLKHAVLAYNGNVKQFLTMLLKKCARVDGAKTAPQTSSSSDVRGSKVPGCITA
eukprot:751375-Hanusia_phi.AAC.1